MKWLVEDCENPSAPVGNRLDAVTRSRSVFAANPFVKKAVLFGSFARGEQKDSSDVDFFLGLDPSCTSSDYLSMLDSLASALGRDVDVTVRLNGATDRFIENLKTEGVLIYFRDLGPVRATRGACHLPPSPRRVPLERTRDDRRAHGPERQQESPGYVDDRAEDREEALYAGLVRPRYAGAPRAYQFLSQHGSSPCRDACVCGERLSVNPMISARADIAAAARPMEKAGEVYGLEWVRIQPTLGKPQRMQRHILPAPPGATRWLNRARQRAQAGQTPSSVGGLRQHPVGKHHLDELVFGIPRGVDLALIGVHVAVEPDDQLAALRLVLAHPDQLIDGHVGAVARGVIPRELPAELQGAPLVQAGSSIPISFRSSGDDHLRYGISSYWRATLRYSSGL